MMSLNCTAATLAKQAVKRSLRRAQGGVCPYCGHALPELPKLWSRAAAAAYRQASLDHVVPTWLNGPDAVGNLMLAHPPCNHWKHSRPPYPCELIFLMGVNARLGVGPTEWRCAA